jgi:hypothetical protein
MIARFERYFYDVASIIFNRVMAILNRIIILGLDLHTDKQQGVPNKSISWPFIFGIVAYSVGLQIETF